MSIFDYFDSGITGINAPEFPKGLTWLNSPPLSIKELTDKVTLIDFWTYSCINCQRTLLYLQKWHEKYHSKGLVIIGVHTPEFEFEKDAGNVKKALKKYSISWPTILDNDYQIWNAYANHYWPAKYLINHRGKIIFTHFGEGNYIETEIQIQKTLKDAGFKVDDTMVGNLSEEAARLGQTSELYCGYKRGILGNDGGYLKDQEFNYQAPRDLEPDFIYLQGFWKAMPEYVEHPEETKDLDNLVILSYRAKKLYLVMESDIAGPIKAYITLDGVGLTRSNAGDDIRFDEEGRAYTEVKFATIYNLISTATFGDHIIRISTLKKGLRLFAFTFGS